MISFKCKNCGGKMSVDSSGALVCEYCGGKSFFADKELTVYKEFRKQMLSYLRGIHDEKLEGDKSEDYLWDSAEEEQLEMAEKIYSELKAVGIDVLLDDRKERAGVKFKDCDLIGYPIRVTVGPKSVEEGTVELRIRKTGETIVETRETFLSKVKTLLETL